MKTKFAIVDGQRREAEPGLAGLCQACGSPMIPKCGELRIWHWAHKGVLLCNSWSEPETPWHRGWKNEFPTDWQEIVHRAGSGEKHVADVKTAKGHVIEFQHSYLKPEQRRSREAFYESMVWVVNGLRRQRDKSQFYENLLRPYDPVRQRVLRYKMPSEGSALLRDWCKSTKDVFFDFGVTQEEIARFGSAVLWHLSPKSPAGWAIVTPVPVASFIVSRHNGTSLKAIPLPESYLKMCESQLRLASFIQTRPLSGFQLHLARRRKAQMQRRF